MTVYGWISVLAGVSGVVSAFCFGKVSAFCFGKVSGHVTQHVVIHHRCPYHPSRRLQCLECVMEENLSTDDRGKVEVEIDTQSRVVRRIR